MTESEPIRWQFRRLFQRPPARGGFDAAVVRLIDPPLRPPATPLEHRLISILKKAGPVSYENLVKTVADELYAEELRKGGGLLDIGLFGGRLFNGDVIQELKAADGTLWEIKPERDTI